MKARDAIVTEAADLLKLMANPNRLAILCCLVEGETSVGEMELTLGIRQPTLSQQLGELRKAGLIVDRREAKTVFYSLADRRARAVVRHVHDLFCNPPAAEEPVASETAARLAVPNGSRGPAHAAVFAEILDREETERAAG